MIGWRDLGLAGKAVAAGVAAVVLILAIMLLASWWDDLWDWLPWSQEQRLERAEATAVHAQDDASARGLEAEGERASATRSAAHERQVGAARAVTAATATQALESPDASDPLPADRRDRLRAHDGELCRLRPDLVGCPAAEADPS